MRRASLAVTCGLLLSTASAGATSHLDGAAVTVRLYSHVVAPGEKTVTRVDRFTLSCGPAAGDLPFAARVCRDIALHPVATLAPAAPRTLCSGTNQFTRRGTTPYRIEITTVAGGRTSSFGSRGIAECDWPTGWAAGLYWAAALGDAKQLSVIEARLDCLEDRASLAKPTPWPRVYACMGWPLPAKS